MINACAGPNGSLRMAAAGGTCRPHEQPVSWNIAGPMGPTGPAGPAGPEGAAGRDDRDGRDGRDAEAPPIAAPSIIGQLSIVGVQGIPSNATTPILNFATGATVTGSIGPAGGGVGAGKVNFSDFVITKVLDGFSTPLLQAASAGRHIQAVKIEIFEPGGTTVFATYTLEDAFITSDMLASTLNGVLENVSFAFAKLRTRIELGGMVFQSCFDIAEIKGC